MTYLEYAKFLQDKNGIPEASYFSDEGFLNSSISKETEGLFIFHIMNYKAYDLENYETALQNDISYQKPENLCYGNPLEILELTLKMSVEYGNNLPFYAKETVFKYITIINSLFEEKDENSPFYQLIKENYKEYISLLSQCLDVGIKDFDTLCKNEKGDIVESIYSDFLAYQTDSLNKKLG